MGAYNPPIGPTAPWFPSFAGQLMPQVTVDGMIQNNGIRLGWMKAHECPCTLGTAILGSPDPNCRSCHGRGIYWDPWSMQFIGLLTYMHTSSAPDEPGVILDNVAGNALYAEPTLTIPQSGYGDEATVWAQAAEFDAYVELDAVSRFSSVLQVGGSVILPYQQQLVVQDVAIWNPVTKMTSRVPSSAYRVTGGAVVLNPSYPEGTSYTVEYQAASVYVAYRRAGAVAHIRPFGLGTANIPRRFRIVTLDLWTRARQNGYLGQSTSPQGLPVGAVPVTGLMDEQGNVLFDDDGNALQSAPEPTPNAALTDEAGNILFDEQGNPLLSANALNALTDEVGNVLFDEQGHPLIAAAPNLLTDNFGNPLLDEAEDDLNSV